MLQSIFCISHVADGHLQEPSCDVESGLVVQSCEDDKFFVSLSVVQLVTHQKKGWDLHVLARLSSSSTAMAPVKQIHIVTPLLLTLAIKS